MEIKRFILDETRKQRLAELEEGIKILEEEMEKARSVGLNVDKIQAQLTSAKTLRANILKVYG